MKNNWNFIADMHTHTIASDHAYSTVLENIKQAKERGLMAVASTDHGPAIKDSPDVIHFTNLRALPLEIDGVRLLKGAEVNLLNADGDLDLDIKHLKKLDWVIASFHKEVLVPMDKEAHTQAYLNALNNPYVDMLGHTGNPIFPYDEEMVIKEAARCGKVIELNESSPISRPGSEENCFRILSLCKRYGVFVCVDSDAHFCSYVGSFPKSKILLDRLDFPKELVINADIERFNNYLKKSQMRKKSAIA